MSLGQQVTPMPEDKELALPKTQEEVLRQSFEATVSPLREAFGERLGATQEELARKGIAFGDVGSQALADLLKEQSRQEAQIAAGLGGQLGQTAMQQAFQTSEAAKAREFQAEQAQLGREFAAEEAVLGREFTSAEQEAARGFAGEQSDLQRRFQEEQARLGRELTQEEASLQRRFLEEESRLGRELTQEEAAYQRAFAQEEARLGRELTQQEAEAQRALVRETGAAERDFQAEQALLGRELTQEEAALQREFQAASQAQAQEFQATQAQIERQEVRNDQMVDLILSGNITNEEEARAAIEEIFGEGITLTNEDDLALQRIAAASGLSVEDYTNLKSALGQGQLDLILEKDANGNYVNLDDFILDPAAQQRFLLEMARIEADAQVSAAEAQSGKVLCSELYRQGLLPEDIYRADQEVGREMPVSVVVGYHMWAVPLVEVMKKSKLVTNILKPFVKSWAYHMAYRKGVIEKDNILGKVLETIGLPICNFIGSQHIKSLNKRRFELNI